MTKTRNNHYVPQWYQEGFFEPGRKTYSYLDLSPRQHTLSDGRVFTEKSKFVSPTSRAFCQRDLYSTFFGTTVNDEIVARQSGWEGSDNQDGHFGGRGEEMIVAARR